jgi:hypothetical protein
VILSNTWRMRSSFIVLPRRAANDILPFRQRQLGEIAVILSAQDERSSL